MVKSPKGGRVVAKMTNSPKSPSAMKTRLPPPKSPKSAKMVKSKTKTLTTAKTKTTKPMKSQALSIDRWVRRLEKKVNDDVAIVVKVVKKAPRRDEATVTALWQWVDIPSSAAGYTFVFIMCLSALH